MSSESYTRVLTDARSRYIDAELAERISHNPGEKFDAALEQVRREARAEALRETAEAYPIITRDMVSRQSVKNWLSERAHQEENK